MNARRLLAGGGVFGLFRPPIKPSESLRDLIPPQVAREFGMIITGFVPDQKTLNVAVDELLHEKARQRMEVYRDTQAFNERLTGISATRTFSVAYDLRPAKEIQTAIDQAYRFGNDLALSPQPAIAECLPYDTAVREEILLERVIGHEVHAICVTSGGATILQGLMSDPKFRARLGSVSRVDPSRLQLKVPVQRVSAVYLRELIGRTYSRNTKRDTGSYRVSLLAQEFSGAGKTDSQPAQKAPQLELSVVDKLINEIVAAGYLAKAADLRLYYDFAKQGVVISHKNNNIEREYEFYPMPNGRFEQLLTVLIRRCEGVENEGIKTITHSGMLDFRDLRLKDGSVASLSARLETTPISTQGVPGAINMSCCLRLQKGGDAFLELEMLGFLESELRILIEFGLKKHGLIVLNGPTGSGKNATIFGLVIHIKKKKAGWTVFSIENPKEVDLQSRGVFQCEVSKTLSAANILRSILRQAPDAIVTTEMRDAENARTTLDAALTGHVVFSTIHTSTPFHAPIRLLNLSNEQFPISGMDVGMALAGVVSQVLARKTCPTCREADYNWKERLRNSEFHGSQCESFLVFLRHLKIPTTLEEAHAYAIAKAGRRKWEALGNTLKSSLLREARQNALPDEQTEEIFDRILTELGAEECGSFEMWIRQNPNPYIFRPTIGTGKVEGRPCPTCRNEEGAGTGVSGRTVIPEIWDPEPFRSLLSTERPSPELLHRAAMRRGHVTLHVAGLQRVMAGTVSIDNYLDACGPIDLGYQGVPGYRFDVAEMQDQEDEIAALEKLMEETPVQTWAAEPEPPPRPRTVSPFPQGQIIDVDLDKAGSDEEPLDLS
jgi:hypothetical protein